MGALTGDLRVLQILGDTDAEDDGRAALDLHRGLTRLGVEVRTLALAPGAEAGLADTVPTMSPSSRSIAAHTQLRREQRWADVVILRGERPAVAAGMAPIRGAAPVVLYLADEAERWLHSPVPSRALRLAGRASALAVTCRRDAGVAERLGLGADLVSVVPYGAEPVGPASGAERRAARRALGLPFDGIVALVLAGPDTAAVREQAARAGLVTTVVEPVDDRVVHFGDGGRIDASELAIAAADVVVAAGGATCGPSWTLLHAASAGLAVVAPATGALGDLVDDDTGWTDVAQMESADIEQVRARGLNAAARVADRFSTGVVADRWVDLVTALVDR